MKVYQVLEKKQLNEALPLIGGIGLGGILTAISIGIAAWSAYDIYKFIGKYGEDPESITNEDWQELFIDAILLFTPGFLKVGRAGVAKLVPNSVKKTGGSWIKKLVNKRYREVMAKRAARGKFSVQGLQGKARLDMLAKRAAVSKTAAEAADTAIKKNASLAQLLKILGLGAVIGNYLIQIAAIEEDFEELSESITSGKEVSNDNIFKGMSYEQAKEQGQLMRQDLLGEASIQIIGLGLAGAFISGLGRFLNLFGIVGKLFGIPLQIAGWIGSIGGTGAKMQAVRTGLTAWFSTESGQEFLKQFSIGLLIVAAGQLVKSALGPIASWSVDTIVSLLDEALKFVSEQTGIPLKVPDVAKSPFNPVSPNASTAALDAQRAANIKYVGGVPATTMDGFLRADRDFWLMPKLYNLVKRAEIEGKPHPLQGLQLDPKKQYPQDLMKKVNFVPS